MKRRIIGLASGWRYNDIRRIILLPEEEVRWNKLKKLGYTGFEKKWVEDPYSIGAVDSYRYGTLYLYAVKEDNGQENN